MDHRRDPATQVAQTSPLPAESRHTSSDRVDPRCPPLSRWEADTALEILESSVGPQRIKGRAQQDGRLESRFIGLVQPDHRLVLIAKSHIDQRDIGTGRRVLIMPGLQVVDYFYCLFRPSRYGINKGEIGVEGPTVSGKLDRSLKLRDGFIVHVLLFERLT
jgi:hypothetical protein